MTFEKIPLCEEAELKLSSFKDKHLPNIPLRFLKKCFEPVFNVTLLTNADLIKIVQHYGFLAYNYLYASLILLTPWIESLCEITEYKRASFYAEAQSLKLDQNLMFRYIWYNCHEQKTVLKGDFLSDIDNCLAQGYIEGHRFNSCDINDRMSFTVLFVETRDDVYVDTHDKASSIIKINVCSSITRYVTGQYVVLRTAMKYDSVYQEYFVCNCNKFVYSKEDDVRKVLHFCLNQVKECENQDCTYNPFI